MKELTCFKAYDIRGKLGGEVNEDVAYRVGRAFACFLKAKTVVVGGDARATSESLKLALARGLQDQGCNVIDIGMVGTEEIYFATSHLKVDGGIIVTASHNPIDYNGMKLVREESKPISNDTGLSEIKKLAEINTWSAVKSKGQYKTQSTLDAYVKHLLAYITPERIKPLKLVVNAGNGIAGHVIDALEFSFKALKVPVQFIKVHHDPDPTFPNGIPNPLLPENRHATSDAVKKHKADMGIAWDGDFDRCFLFDENGAFVEGYYIVGLLAEAFLQKKTKEKIIYDPRVYWNTEEIIKANDGIPIMSKTGHAFIKERMRKEDAIYGGEMSAHHYFRDFFYCDSGMIPWLLVAELLCVRNLKLSDAVSKRVEKYPSSGERNLKVDDALTTLKNIEKEYANQSGAIVDKTDGLNISFPDWRFSLRCSNTEPLIRLNVESRGDKSLMSAKTNSLLNEIKSVKKDSPKVANIATGFRGAVDAFEVGVVRGWAVQDGGAEPLEILVICDDKIIGHGVADQYRADLEKAKINEGNHGFSIDVSMDWPKKPGEITIELLDAKTTRKVLKEPKKLNIQGLFYGGLMTLDHGHVVTRFSSKVALGQKKVVLFHEDEKIATLDVDSEEKSVEIRIPLPAKYLDGRSRNYKFGILGVPEILSMGVFQANPIQTPWEYIKESYELPGFMSMPKQADSRYESLHYHLAGIAKGEGMTGVENLYRVHSVVVEGHHKRTKFPNISLPVVKSPEVSIIVPAYNKFELTYHCIASIALAYNKTSYEVILADDCSEDETAEAESIIDNLVVSRNEENLRFLRSCNKASELAQGRYVIFLNNDTEVTSHWIDELIEKHQEDDSIGLTGSKLLNLDGTMQEAGGIVWGTGQPWNVGRNLNPLTPEYNYAREVDYLTGAAMCIRKDVWEKVGRFSEELVPCYYEDTDIAFKVRKAGFKTVYVPHSQVVHFEGQSHGTDVKKGLKRYQVLNESTFRQKWFKEFRNNGKPSMANLHLEKDRNIDQRVLFIDYATPMPNKDAGSYAVIQEMKLIQSLGFKVTFVPANLAHFGKYTTALQKLGIEVLYAPFYHSVMHVLESRLQEFDAVYIVRYETAKNYVNYIQSNSSAKILFNNCDLHFLRQLRAALRGQKDQAKIDKALVTRAEELGVCQTVDAILCYNSTEHAVITSHILEAEKLHITPWVLEAKPKGPKFAEREGIAFLGGFAHTPNLEAVEYLVDEVMPLLEKVRPEIKLSVFGSNMPAKYKDFETSNVVMVGFAESLDSVYHEHRVFVAPLLSGAGIKGKVLESLAYGLPTVLTDVAAEGTGLTHGISTLIASEPQEWVDSIINLYDNEVLWNKFSDNSATLVEANYSAEHGQKVFKEIFSSVGIYSSRSD